MAAVFKVKRAVFKYPGTEDENTLTRGEGLYAGLWGFKTNGHRGA
jgi:hypothetical protein